MPKEITNAQRNALKLYRTVKEAEKLQLSQNTCYQAYYGVTSLQDMEELFSKSTHLTKLAGRNRAISVGFITELAINPNMTLEELYDFTSPEGMESKARTKEYLQSYYREENPDSVEKFNKLYVKGLKVFAKKIQKEILSGTFDDYEKSDAFCRKYYTLLEGTYDTWCQFITTKDWDSTGIDEKEKYDLLGAMIWLGRTGLNGNGTNVDDVLDGASYAENAAMLSCSFSTTSALKKEAKELFFQGFKLKQRTGLQGNINPVYEETDVPIYRGQQDMDAEGGQLALFNNSFDPVFTENYGILDRLDEFDQLLLMIDPSVKKFVQFESNPDHTFKRATYAGMDLKYNKPANTITNEDVEAVRTHMYLNISPELYRTLDRETKHTISEVRKANSVISEINQDSIRDFRHFVDNEIDELNRKTSWGQSSSYYKEIIRKLEQLKKVSRDLDTNNKDAVMAYEELLAETIMATTDYLGHKSASITPTPGEKFKNDYEIKRVAQVRKLYGMLTKNMGVFSDHTMNVDKIKLTEAVQKSYNGHEKFRANHTDDENFMEAEKRYVIAGDRLATLAVSSGILNSVKTDEAIDLMADMCVPYLYYQGYRNQANNLPNPVKGVSNEVLRDTIKNIPAFQELTKEVTPEKITSFLLDYGPSILMKQALTEKQQLQKAQEKASEQTEERHQAREGRIEKLEEELLQP